MVFPEQDVRAFNRTLREEKLWRVTRENTTTASQLQNQLQGQLYQSPFELFRGAMVNSAVSKGLDYTTSDMLHFHGGSIIAFV